MVDDEWRRRWNVTTPVVLCERPCAIGHAWSARRNFAICSGRALVGEPLGRRALARADGKADVTAGVNAVEMIDDVLRDRFGLRVLTTERVPLGYLTDNTFLDSDRGRFFLKRYRDETA